MAGTTTSTRDTLARGSAERETTVQLNKAIDDIEILRTGVAELAGSAVYDPASLADGAGVTTTVTVTGAALGDFAQASFSVDLASVMLFAWVSAANTVSVRFQNETAGIVDLASGTITVRVSTPSLVDAAADLTASKVGDSSGTAIA